MTQCSHTRFVSNQWGDDNDDYFDWSDDREVSTFRDIDEHRFECTQCGEIRYYSIAARNFFEEGIPHPLFFKKGELK